MRDELREIVCLPCHIYQNNTYPTIKCDKDNCEYITRIIKVFTGKITGETIGTTEVPIFSDKNGWQIIRLNRLFNSRWLSSIANAIKEKLGG